MANAPILIRLTEQRQWRARDVYTGLSHASTRLPRGEKQALLGMSRSGEGYVVDDIFRTNGFHVTVEGVDHTGLYPEIAVGFGRFWSFVLWCVVQGRREKLQEMLLTMWAED